MPHVNVSIAGKTYRMACGEGEEDHLSGLAADLDGRVAQMRVTFGEIGDMRLHVMAALTLVDELAEVKARLAATEGEAAKLRDDAASGETAIAQSVERVAERIERLTRTLSGPPAPAFEPSE